MTSDDDSIGAEVIALLREGEMSDVAAYLQAGRPFRDIDDGSLGQRFLACLQRGLDTHNSADMNEASRIGAEFTLRGKEPPEFGQAVEASLKRFSERAMSHFRTHPEDAERLSDDMLQRIADRYEQPKN